MQPTINLIKKYWYVIPILAIAYLAFKKLGSSGGNSQVVNRVIPVSTESDRAELLETEYSFQLGKLQLQNQVDVATKSIEAEKQRLQFQNEALALSGQLSKEQLAMQNTFGLQALAIESERVKGNNELQRNLAEISRDATLYDTTQRTNAALELQRQAQQSSFLQQLTGIGAGLLQNLLKNQQQQQQQRSSGGSSGGSSGSSGGSLSPAQSAQQRAAQQAQSRQNALATVGNWLTRSFGNQNFIQSLDYPQLGSATGYDLQQFYDAEINAFDNWLNFDPPTQFGEPSGSVSSSFNPGGLFLGDNFSFSDYWSDEDEFNYLAYGY